MYSISEKIIIGRKVPVAKDSFVNHEIGKSVKIKFTCCHCGNQNTVEIIPYVSGFAIFQLFKDHKILSKNDLLENNMVTETSENLLHFGELTVNNLPTLYFGTDCRSCHLKYIGVFSYGEKQPGLELLTVSGIWNYTQK